MTRPKAFSYIRFSTPEQENGDSSRRQKEPAEKYAKEHGLELDTSLRLTDKGLSAFYGYHRTKGALGQFMKLVEKGEIPEGSVLLVESLDRLSREQVLDALTQFTSIISAGVKVVTLVDKMEYDRQSVNANFGQLLMSLVIMSRAHDESLTKGKRLAGAWQNKRAMISKGIKLTAKAPLWLRLSEDKMKFEIIPERADIVKLIYKKRLDGIGIERIAKELNESRPVWRPKNGWRNSYIVKILNGKAVIGEFQPHKKVNGKRVPEGEPFPNYYPAIISKKLFDRMQSLIQHNRSLNGNAGGRTGKARNLFTHLVKCGHCGGPMAYIDKGSLPKGGQFLVCDRARRGMGCSKDKIPYKRTEREILTYCKGLNASEILPGNKERQTGLKVLQNEMQAIEGELAQLEGKISNLLDSIAGTNSKELRQVLEERAKEFLARKSELTQQQGELQNQLHKLEQSSKDTTQQLHSTKKLIDYMEKQEEGESLITLRLNLRSQLRRLIRIIRVNTETPSVALFFESGERRLLTLEEDKVSVLDAYPKKYRQVG